MTPEREVFSLSASDCGVIRVALRSYRHKQERNLQRMQLKFGAEIDPEQETTLTQRIDRVSLLLKRFDTL